MTQALPQHPVRPSRLAAWGQLFRLPNLLTVPGDPVAGFLLASMATGGGVGLAIIPAAAASVLLYAAGLVANDLFDLRIDRRERPGRPLPSGRIRPATAGIVLAALTSLGVACAFLAGAAAGAVALALTAAIFLYDGLTKRIRLAAPGAVNMGLCRGLSLLLGAAAAGGMDSWPVLTSALGLTAYIAVVTWIARGETRPARLGAKRFAPVILLAGWLGFVLVPARTGGRLELMAQAAAAIPALCALGWVGWCGLRLGGRAAPGDIQRAVGGLIGALLPIQATLCASASPPGLIAAAVLMAAWPVFAVLSRRFHPS